MPLFACLLARFFVVVVVCVALLLWFAFVFLLFVLLFVVSLLGALGGACSSILQWEGFIFMGALFILFAPFASLTAYPMSFFYGNTLPADTRVANKAASKAQAFAAAAVAAGAAAGGAAAGAGGASGATSATDDDYEYVTESGEDSDDSDDSSDSEQQEYEYVYETETNEVTGTAGAKDGSYVYEYEDIATTADPNKVVEDSSDASADVRPGFVVLTLAIVMGVTSGANIGNGIAAAAAYGMVGSVGQAAYMLSLLVLPLFVYFLRTGSGKFTSMTEAIHSRYGKIGAWLYIAAVAYQLFKMLVQNAAFVAAYFYEWQDIAAGPYMIDMPFGVLASVPWRPVTFYVAYGLVLLVPLLALLGKGARYWMMMVSVPAFVTAIVCLGLYLSQMRKETEDMYERSDFVKAGDWEMKTGLDYLILTGGWAFFSSGLFNPVMVDHAFLSSPKRMVVAFYVAFVISGAVIILASALGLYGYLQMANNMATTPLFSGPAILLERFGTFTSCMAFYVQLIFSMTCVGALYVSAARLISKDVWGLFITGAPLSHAQASRASLKWGRVSMFIFGAAAGVMCIIDDEFFVKVTNVAIDPTMMLGLAPALYAIFFVGGTGTKKWLLFVLPLVASLVLGILDAIDGETLLHKNDMYIGKGASGVSLAVAAVALGGSSFVFAVMWAIYRFAWLGADRFYANDGDAPKPAPAAADAEAAAAPTGDGKKDEEGSYVYVSEVESDNANYEYVYA